MDAAGDKLNEELREVADAAEELLGKARPAVEELAGHVRKHPIAALGIAAGVGLVVGLLLSRK